MGTLGCIEAELVYDGLMRDVVVLRPGSDGLSAVVIAEAEAAGRVADKMRARGRSVTFEDSENPAFVSLRIR